MSMCACVCVYVYVCVHARSCTCSTSQLQGIKRLHFTHARNVCRKMCTRFVRGRFAFAPRLLHVCTFLLRIWKCIGILLDCVCKFTTGSAVRGAGYGCI